MVIRNLLINNDMNVTIHFTNFPHEDRVKWDKFVENSPDGLPTHLASWKKILQNTYGYNCYFLRASKDDHVVGVLPLFHIRSRITGNSLQSMPGAICAQSPEIALRLIDEAEKIAEDIRVDYLFLRDSRRTWSDSNLKYIEANRGIRITLPGDPELAWKKLHHGLRKQVRQGRKNSKVSVKVFRDDAHDFFQAFLTFSRQIGTPLFGQQFISNILKEFNEKCLIITVYHEDEPIAGFFCLILSNKILGIWGGGIHDARQAKATQRAYWKLIEYGCLNDITVLDLGRSPYPSSQYNFKEKWGDESYPIFQLYKLYSGQLPKILDPRNNKSGNGSLPILNQIWSLLPLKLVGRIGPKIRWHIPFG